MQSILKRALTGMFICGAVVGFQAVNSAEGQAATSCQGAGYLCFKDYESGQYGNVSGNNSNWGAFGWNDRADWFRNDGNTHNVCVYKDHKYGGTAKLIKRGSSLEWKNIVSSNYWVSGTTCP